MKHPTGLHTTFTALALALVTTLPAQAAEQRTGHAHEHGTARLGVVIEGQNLSITLEAPLDNLLGFERAPRTDAERRQTDTALGLLRDGALLFRTDPAAGCTLRSADLRSAALKLGGAAAPAEEGHADLDADYSYSCTDANKLTTLDIGLFRAFARMQRIEVQGYTPRGQFKRTLRSPGGRLDLTGR